MTIGSITVAVELAEMESAKLLDVPNVTRLTAENSVQVEKIY